MLIILVHLTMTQSIDQYTYQVSVHLPSISILTKHQYTYQVSVYLYLLLVFLFPNTDTSYFKNVLEY
jgi:hypothetical protein